MKKLVCMGFIVLIISISACQSATMANAETTPTAELRNTLWKLANLDGKAIQTREGQRMASLTLSSEESRARIATACNSGSAAFTVDGKKLKFDVAMSTKMACEQDRMQEESAFFKVIENTASYEIKGEILELHDAAGKLLASFHAEYLQ